MNKYFRKIGGTAFWSYGVLSLALFFASVVVSDFVYHQSEVGRKIASQDETYLRPRVIEPERNIFEVHKDSKAEKVARLKDARVMIADYDLIKRDFPHIKHLSNPEIDEWILNQVAYVSLPQTKQTEVNNLIPITEETREAYRPPEYGRALVYEMKDPVNPKEKIGLIDVKGTGGLKPAQKGHSNGVATLGECVREFLMENLVRDVLDDANIANKTVASYAVIDAGFKVKHADGSFSPAGLYLRQAQERIPNPGAWLNANTRTHLQSILRKYGIDPEENVQGTKTNDIIDFGHFVIKDDMPEIDKAKQVPYHLWGHDKKIKMNASLNDLRWFYSKQDYPWIWSHELADAFAKGEANRHHAWMHFENLINPAREKLNLNRTVESPLWGYSTIKEYINFLKRTGVESTDSQVLVRDAVNKNPSIIKPLDKESFDKITELLKRTKDLPKDAETIKFRKLLAKEAIEYVNIYSSLELSAEVKNILKTFSPADKLDCPDLVKAFFP